MLPMRVGTRREGPATDGACAVAWQAQMANQEAARYNLADYKAAVMRKYKAEIAAIDAELGEGGRARNDGVMKTRHMLLRPPTGSWCTRQRVDVRTRKEPALAACKSNCANIPCCFYRRLPEAIDTPMWDEAALGKELAYERFAAIFGALHPNLRK